MEETTPGFHASLPGLGGVGLGCAGQRGRRRPGPEHPRHAGVGGSGHANKPRRPLARPCVPTPAPSRAHGAQSSEGRPVPIGYEVSEYYRAARLAVRAAPARRAPAPSARGGTPPVSAASSKDCVQAACRDGSQEPGPTADVAGPPYWPQAADGLAPRQGRRRARSGAPKASRPSRARALRRRDIAIMRVCYQGTQCASIWHSALDGADRPRCPRRAKGAGNGPRLQALPAPAAPRPETAGL